MHFLAPSEKFDAKGDMSESNALQFVGIDQHIF